VLSLYKLKLRHLLIDRLRRNGFWKFSESLGKGFDLAIDAKELCFESLLVFSPRVFFVMKFDAF